MRNTCAMRNTQCALPMGLKVALQIRNTQYAIRNGSQSGPANTQYAIRNTQWVSKWAAYLRILCLPIRNTQWPSKSNLRIWFNTQYAKKLQNTQSLNTLRIPYVTLMRDGGVIRTCDRKDVTKSGADRVEGSTREGPQPSERNQFRKHAARPPHISKVYTH